MKALLLKDFLTLSRMIRTIVIIMLIIACVPQLNMSTFFMVYCAILPITAVAYDERTRWDVQAAMMPYRPWEIVVSKYVFGYILVALMAVLAMLTGIVVGQVTGAPLTGEQCLTEVIYALAVTVVLAFSLPLVIRFGAEKGRLSIGIGFGVGFGVLVALVPLLNDHMDAIMLTTRQIAAIVFLFIAAVNLISIRLSIRFYRRKLA